MFNKAYIEITNVCNLACAFCPGHARQPCFMGVEAFGRVLAELKGRARQLYFHVMGEPLLHPQLGVLLRMAAETGFPVNLTTNGTLLPDAVPMLATALSLRQINVSLHSDAGRAGPQIFGDGRRAEGHSHSAVTLDAVAALKAARPLLLVSLRLWNLREDPAANAARIQNIADFFGAQTPLPRDRSGYKLGEGLWVNEAEVFDWPSLVAIADGETAEAAAESGETAFCRALRDQVAILCDGTVTACCLDAEGTLSLGNVLDQPLDEILRGPRARAIIEGFSRRRAVEPLCRRCGYRKRFDR